MRISLKNTIVISVLAILICTTVFGYASIQLKSQINCAMHENGFICKILDIVIDSIIPTLSSIALLYLLTYFSLKKEKNSTDSTSSSYINLYKKRKENFSIKTHLNKQLRLGLVHPKIY